MSKRKTQPEIILDNAIYNTTAAANFLGVSVATIKKLVASGVLTPTRLGRANVFGIGDLTRLKRERYREGLGHVEIARIYGKTKSQVRIAVRKLGIQPLGVNMRQRRANSPVYAPATVKKMAKTLGWEAVNGETHSDAAAPPAPADAAAPPPSSHRRGIGPNADNAKNARTDP